MIPTPRLRHNLSAVAASLVLAAPAAAQEGGVYVDPDSPSGKQYEIPLESVRRQSHPKSAGKPRVRQGERSSPLFGEGIEPDAPAGGAGAGSGGSGSGGGGSAGGRAAGRGSRGAGAQDRGGESPEGEPRPAEREIVGVAASRPGAPDGGVGTSLLIAGGAALVLALGAGAGLLARRSRRGQ